MGYELDRLLERIGVSSPTLSYSGINKPIAPAALGANATAEQAQVYNDLVAKYNADMPQYEADQAAYAPYKAEYQNRLANFDMYAQPQFNTGASPVAPASAMSAETAVYGPDGKMYPSASAALAAGVTNYTLSPPTGVSPLVPPTYGAPASPDGFTPLNPMDVPNATPPTSQNNVINNSGGSDSFNSPGANPSTGTWSGYDPNSYTGGLLGALMGQQDPAPVEDRGTSLTNNLSGDRSFGGSDTNDHGGPGAAGSGSTGGGLGGVGGSGTEGANGPGDGTAADYARGGAVRKTHFQVGGLNDMAASYEVTDPAIEDMTMPVASELSLPAAAPAAKPPANLVAQVGGQAVPPGLLEMLSKYQGEGAYAGELKTARETASLENKAFNKMLQDAINQQSDNAPSKSEMYFRLAAAFGAPTKTGGFSESLANVGKTLGEHAKETREAAKASRASRLALGLEAQKAKMTGAKEDLTTLRTLAGEEMKDKRAIASELLKDYVRSGQPQSAAGKQALDEGLVAGTPAFQARVAKIAEMNLERQLASINATLAGVNASQANAALAQRKFGLQEEQAKKLTPAEMKLKTETEDTLGGLEQASAALKRAYALNPNTFDTSLPDTVRRKALEAAGSKDKKLENTRLQENLLQEKALAGLKAAVGGNPTEGERKVLMDLQGIGAKSVEERKNILLNAFRQLEITRAREKKRLDQISSGAYRDTTGGFD